MLPFQELSRRKRKDVKEEDIKVKVHLFAFDLLYLNGEVCLLLSWPFASTDDYTGSARRQSGEATRIAAKASTTGRGRIRFRYVGRCNQRRGHPDLPRQECSRGLRGIDGEDAGGRGKFLRTVPTKYSLAQGSSVLCGRGASSSD